MTELKHIGVLGMKWGRRKAESSPGSSDHQVVKSLREKKLHELSNEELRKITSRIQLEKQYKDLAPTKTARGKKKVGEILGLIGKVSAFSASVVTLAVNGKKIYDLINKK